MKSSNGGVSTFLKKQSFSKVQSELKVFASALGDMAKRWLLTTAVTFSVKIQTHDDIKEGARGTVVRGDFPRPPKCSNFQRNNSKRERNAPGVWIF